MRIAVDTGKTPPSSLSKVRPGRRLPRLTKKQRKFLGGHMPYGETAAYQLERRGLGVVKSGAFLPNARGLRLRLALLEARS